MVTFDNPKYKYKRECLGLEELEVVGGGYFDDEAEEAGDFEKYAFFCGATDADKMAFVAVHRSGTYEPHATAVHLRGYLGKCHVIRLLHESDGRDEAVHVGRAHGHRLAIGAAFDETILERVGPGDNRIESVSSSEHKKQVADKGDFLADATAATHGDLSLHGSEDLKSVGSELFVGGIFCVGPLEVTHGKPLGLLFRYGIHFSTV